MMSLLLPLAAVSLHTLQALPTRQRPARVGKALPLAARRPRFLSCARALSPSPFSPALSLALVAALLVFLPSPDVCARRWCGVIG